MRGTFAIPEAAHQVPDTGQAEVDLILTELSERRRQWQETSIPERIGLLRRSIEQTSRIADQWVGAACIAKGIDPDRPVAGEEWQSGPALVIRNLRLLATTLESIAKDGRPPVGKVSTRPDGVTTVETFPTDIWDSLLFMGVRAEVWMQNGVTEDNLFDHMAATYRVSTASTVCVVLGAGNVSSIPAMDALYKLVVENSVVVLKMNPVNAYLTPLLEQGLSPLVEAGVLAFANGGADLGQYLVNHPMVETIHITGSDKAHDAIVFGNDQIAQSRKRDNRPLLQKPITAELGNVSPVIVVPGPWSRSDFRFQGANLASGLTHNAGFNCIANRVIVTHREWDAGEALIEHIQASLAKIPTRAAYYPGAKDRFESYASQYRTQMSSWGNPDPEHMAWSLISVSPDDESGLCFETECFNGILSETRLPAPSVVDFVGSAVEFCNRRLWGSLGATVIVHPDSLADPEVAAAVDQAIANLRYGSVSVNIWVAVAYAAVTTTWGAYPGHPPNDIGSGCGVVHNSLMFDRPLKSVVRAPFRQFPKPVWFGSNRTAHKSLRALTAHETAPSLWSTLKVARHALLG